MENSIELLLKDRLNTLENKFKEDDIVRQFEKTKVEFEELVKKGYAQERGNNLLSVSDANSKNKVVFNTK